MVQPSEDSAGMVREEKFRKGLFSLVLARNDRLIGNFEPHLLVAILGNIDWRPLINLWSVLEYLFQYSANVCERRKAYEIVDHLVR